MRKISAVVAVTVALAAGSLPARAAEAPYWYEPMKKLNEGFTGNPCYVAQFGDSITYSAPFWKPLNWAVPEQYLPEDGFPKAAKTVYAGDKRWRDLLKGMADSRMSNGCGCWPTSGARAGRMWSHGSSRS